MLTVGYCLFNLHVISIRMDFTDLDSELSLIDNSFRIKYYIVLINFNNMYNQSLLYI